jgi:hypothetical protein
VAEVEVVDSPIELLRQREHDLKVALEACKQEQRVLQALCAHPQHAIEVEESMLFTCWSCHRCGMSWSDL